MRCFLTATLADRLPDRDDDRGMMAFALLAVLIGAMLGALLLPMVVTQSKATTFDSGRVHALNAAQAGVEVAVGRLRASTTALDLENLTCGTSDEVSLTPTATYRVKVGYSTLKPSVSTKTVCPATAESRYAVIASTGTDPTGDDVSRTVVSTYALPRFDARAPGGMIRLSPAMGDAKRRCLVTADDTTVGLGGCQDSTFVYRKDLSIQLASTIGTASERCVDVDGAWLSVDRCGTDRWNFDSSGRIEAVDSDTNRLSGLCLAAAVRNADERTSKTREVRLAPCEGEKAAVRLAWIPAPSVGPGAAGRATEQLVNSQQFSSCVTASEKRANAASRCEAGTSSTQKISLR